MWPFKTLASAATGDLRGHQILHAKANQFSDGDLVGVPSAGNPAAENVAEFGFDRVRRDDAGVDRMPAVAMEAGKLAAVDDDAVCAHQHVRFELAFGRIVCADCGDVHARLQLPLVLFSQPCRWRQPLLEQLNLAGRRWRIVFESSDLSAIHTAIRNGVGIAPLLPGTLPRGTEALHDPLPPPPQVDIALYLHSTARRNPLVLTLADILLRHMPLPPT